MKITLLGHSGFAAEGEKTILVFDYFTDELHLLDKLPVGEKTTIFFASHGHRDHFNSRILKYDSKGAVGYVLGWGIPRQGASYEFHLGKGETAEPYGVPVKAFGTTDEGVSFLLECEGKKLFHAGDLNDWYWEDESTPEELAHDEQWFLDEIQPLEGSAPDLAFVPADGRLGRHALRGALHFQRVMRPRAMALMHLSGGEGLPGELAERFQAEGIQTVVAPLARPGDTFTI